jgi:hypothetical protein
MFSYRLFDENFEEEYKFIYNFQLQAVRRKSTKFTYIFIVSQLDYMNLLSLNEFLALLRFDEIWFQTEFLKNR